MVVSSSSPCVSCSKFAMKCRISWLACSIGVRGTITQNKSQGRHILHQFKYLWVKFGVALVNGGSTLDMVVNKTTATGCQAMLLEKSTQNFLGFN